MFAFWTESFHSIFRFEAKRNIRFRLYRYNTENS